MLALSTLAPWVEIHARTSSPAGITVATSGLSLKIADLGSTRAGWYAVAFAVGAAVGIRRRSSSVVIAFGVLALGYAVLLLPAVFDQRLFFEAGEPVPESVIPQTSRPAWGLLVAVAASAAIVTVGLVAELRQAGETRRAE